MNSQKVKEIKKALEVYCKENKGITILRGGEIQAIPYADILTLINELESKNEKLLDSVETVQSNRCVTKCELTKRALKQFAERIKNEVYPFLQAEMYNKKYFITGNIESDICCEHQNQNIGIIKAQDVLSKWFKVKIDELLKEYESGK